MSAAYTPRDKAAIIIALQFVKAELDPSKPTYHEDKANYDRLFAKLVNITKREKAQAGGRNAVIQ